MQIIDMHCHVLPRVDDGAENMKITRQMFSMAYRQGVRSVIATPHSSGRFRKGATLIRGLCEEIEREIRMTSGVDFRIYPGQEIFYRDSIFQELEDGTVLTLADSRYVLVEFMPDVAYSMIYHAARRFAVSGYRMVLAHVERYAALREDGRMEELKEIGVCFQINVHSIAGKWYNSTTRWCRKMLKNRMIHFIASDMHNAQSRRPRFDMAEAWIIRHLDKDYIEKISWQNAWSLINNQKI